MQPKGGGDTIPAGIILPVKGDRQFRLTVSGPSEAVDADQVKELIDSFEIRGSDPLTYAVRETPLRTP